MAGVCQKQTSKHSVLMLFFSKDRNYTMNSNILNKVRHVKPVSKNELELIETRELLSRLESLRSLQDEFYVSEVAIDLTKDERDEAIASGAIVIKYSAI